MAVIIVLILISIILIYVAGNIRMLHHLNHDLQLVEQKQLIRIGMTNKTPGLLIRTNLPSPSSESPAAK